MSATTQNEFNAASAAAETKNAGMTGWGCFWRVSGALVLFALAMFTLMFGAQAALVAVGALELSALVTSIITWSITGAVYVGAAIAGWMVGSYCNRTLVAREAAKLAAAA